MGLRERDDTLPVTHSVAWKGREDGWEFGRCICGWETRKEFDYRAVNVQLHDHIVAFDDRYALIRGES